MESHTLRSLLTGFFHRQPFHLIAACVKPPSLFLVNNTPLCGWTTLHSFIGRGHPRRVPPLGHRTWCRREHGWTWTWWRPVLSHSGCFLGGAVDALSTAPFPSLPPSPRIPSSLRMHDFLCNPLLGSASGKLRISQKLRFDVFSEPEPARAAARRRTGLCDRMRTEMEEISEAGPAPCRSPSQSPVCLSRQT